MAEPKKDDKKKPPAPAPAPAPAGLDVNRFGTMPAATAEGPTFLGGTPTGFMPGLPSPTAAPGAIPADLKVTRYQAGDDAVPGTWDTKEIISLQDALIAGHYFGPGDEFTRGYFDGSTRTAFRSLLIDSNSTGLSWQDTVRISASSERMTIDPETGQLVSASASAKAKREKAKRKLAVRLTNPSDLYELANQTAYRRLGRRLTTDELQRFVSTYHGQEKGYQQAAFNAQETGGTATAEPSAATAANQFVQETAPTEATGHDFLRVYDTFLSLISRNRRGG